MKKLVVGIVLSSLLLVGCGSNESKKENNKAGVTVTNYWNKAGATDFKEKEMTYKEIPKKVFVNTKPAAELLLHLGLKDNIVGVGADFGRGDSEVKKEYETLKKISTDYVGKELAISTEPDLIFGRGTLFTEEEWGNGSVETLENMKLPTFILESSIQGGTIDSIYSDIEKIGKVFKVEDEANSFSEKLQKKEKTIKKTIGTREKATFAYLHMSTKDEVVVYSAAKETFFQSVFELLNLDNVFKDEKGNVSVEALIKADPDYLIVPDWSDGEGNGVTSDELIEGIKADKRLSGMKAVKENKMYGLDYNAMFGYGYQSFDGIETLAKEMVEGHNESNKK